MSRIRKITPVSALCFSDAVNEFLTSHSLYINVKERELVNRQNIPRFYAEIDGAEVMENGMLKSEHGNGITPAIAAVDLLRNLSGKRIAIGASSNNRREIDVPDVLEESSERCEDSESHRHCWHECGTMLTFPMKRGERCCHCGKQRYREVSLRSDGHGPYCPDPYRGGVDQQ